MSKPAAFQNDLTTGSIYRHLFNLAIPASIGMFFNTLYNLTDNWFAGQISDNALVGLSFSSIVFFLFIGLIAGLQNGTAVMVASEVSHKNTSSIKKIIDNAIGVGLIFSCLIIVLGFMFARDALNWLSNETETVVLAWDYIVILLVGNVAFSMNGIAAGVLMALGDTKTNRNTLIIGFFANILLNALFTFGFGFGVAGLALATVIIKSVSAFYLFHTLKKHIDYRPNVAIKKTLCLKILRQVLPASFNFIIIILGSFITTSFVSTFGDYAVAGYSVGLRLEQVLLLPALGLNSAVLAIAGQNYGAKKYHRISEVYRKSLLIGFCISFVSMPIMIFLSPHLLGFFTEQSNIIDVGAGYLKIDSMAFFGYVIIFVSIATLQAIKHPDFPVIMGFFRQLMLPLLVNYILIILLGYSINWIFISVVIIVLLSTLATVFYTRLQLRKIRNSEV